MSNQKKYPLSLNGDTFNAFKQDFDQMLRNLLAKMEEYESDEATINMKMVVSLAKGQERDFEANGYDAMKDITKPTFKHEISTVMQIKDKKGGSLGGSMKMVWDKELCQYVMQEIDNGQTTLFDDEKEEQEEETAPQPEAAGELPPPAPPQLPPSGKVIDADFKVVEDGESKEEAEAPEADKAASDGGDGLEDTPFGYLRQFIGKKLRVVETAGNVTVRTVEKNKIILSSAGKAADPFYVSREKLLPHVGHNVVCVGYGKDELVNISIECEDCNEVLFDMERPKTSDHPDDYAYENPA